MTPLVIIGAPRSGTNLLRDLLSQSAAITTWPCDEINPIWRHGNLARGDLLTRDDARPRIKHFIRREFDKESSRGGADIVLEKTCANSLRVGFVDAVLPDARYIYLVRNGVDAALSAAKRWRAPFELGYTLRKVRFTPPSDIPLYGLRFLRTRVGRLLSREKSLSSWGPEFAGMRSMVGRRPVEEISALQWKACVDASDADFASIADERVFRLRYESFVGEPAETMAALAGFIDCPDVSGVDISRVRSDLVGRGERETPGRARDIAGLIADTLERHGYS